VWLSQTSSEVVGLRNVRVSTVNPLVVTNTNDSGSGSLRSAVLAAASSVNGQVSSQEAQIKQAEANLAQYRAVLDKLTIFKGK
jgi:hypothetical protein